MTNSIAAILMALSICLLSGCAEDIPELELSPMDPAYGEVEMYTLRNITAEYRGGLDYRVSCILVINWDLIPPADKGFRLIIDGKGYVGYGTERPTFAFGINMKKGDEHCTRLVINPGAGGSRSFSGPCITVPE